MLQYSLADAERCRQVALEQLSCARQAEAAALRSMAACRQAEAGLMQTLQTELRRWAWSAHLLALVDYPLPELVLDRQMKNIQVK